MKKRPNILWIFSDQQPAYTLGCNGDPNSRTPNLDRLAGSGFNFKNAVSGFPLCCPFRGSLLTGLYPQHCVPGHEYRMPPELPTAADCFNAAGYDTAYFGKWHLDGMKEHITPRVGKRVIPRERRGRFGRWLGYENNNMQFDCYVHGHLDAATEVPVTRLPGYETDSLTDYLLDYLREPGREEKPFFAVLSVQPPHNPYLAPAEYQRRYQPQEIKLRPNVAHNPAVENKVRHDLAGIYAMIENLDDNVGRIWNCLRENDLDRDTWILFFSDHGDMESAEDVTPTVLDWLDRNGSKDNWYLHVNYWDPHTPYRAPEKFGNPFQNDPLPAWLTPEEIERQKRETVGLHGIAEINMYNDNENPKFPRQPGKVTDMESGIRRAARCF